MSRHAYTRTGGIHLALDGCLSPDSCPHYGVRPVARSCLAGIWRSSVQKGPRVSLVLMYPTTCSSSKTDLLACNTTKCDSETAIIQDTDHACGCIGLGNSDVAAVPGTMSRETFHLCRHDKASPFYLEEHTGRFTGRGYNSTAGGTKTWL